MLGTFVEIQAPPGSEAAVAGAYARIAHVHARMSFHDEASDLAALRSARPGQSVRVAPETVVVLREAIALNARSGGLFDVAVGARLVAAGFLPRPPAIDLRRITGRTADIEIVGDTMVRCHRPMLIDLGGIAKGFAVDLAIEALRQAGVPRAVVNAGGDLRILGRRRQRVWLREADGTVARSLALADGAVATSANLSFRRKARGRIATPHLGHGRRWILSATAVTVRAPYCALADAMTKIALADPDLAAAMLRQDGGAIVAAPEPVPAA